MSDNILLESREDLRLLQGHGSNDRIDRIVLSGGASRVDGFAEALRDRFDDRSRAVRPVPSGGHRPAEARRRLIGDDLAPVAAVAVGLALRKVGDR